MYQKRLRVARFYTFPVFCFGSLLKAIFDHLGVDFGGFGGPFSMIFRIKGVIKYSMILYAVFCFCSIFGSKLCFEVEPIAMESDS